MKIDIQSLLPAAKSPALNIPTPTVKTQPAPQIVHSPADTVTISNAGRQGASVNQVAGSTETSAASKLRDFIKQYDFHNISPRQMTDVYVEIAKQEKFSSQKEADRFGSFISIEMNTVAEMDPNKPIDMVGHFKWMLNVAEGAASSDPTSYAFAVEYRKQASQALNDVMSFANSDRQHV